LKKIIQYLFLVIGLPAMMLSCKKEKKMDNRITLWHFDKIPYGTKYAYDNLRFIFTDATIKTSDKYPELLTSDDSDSGRKAIIIVGQRFSPDADDFNALLRFAASGNQVFISAAYFGDSLLSNLNCKLNEEYVQRSDSMQIEIVIPGSKQWMRYTYPGFAGDNYFSVIDTAHTAILGKNHNGKADFIRVNFKQGGAFFLHTDPMAFSNFFLLYKNNHTYYDYALSNISEHVRVVEWSDYFRHYKMKPFSALHYILSQQGLRWAFWVLIFLISIVLLIDSKRKQRAIVETPVLKNASEDFVKTIGRLYYEQKNNQNLALKMVIAFLENIRVAYNIPTSQLNDEFSKKLAFRSGQPIDRVLRIVESIHAVRIKSELSDQELMDLHQQIIQFNKQV
jgi:hypothetical protein